MYRVIRYSNWSETPRVIGEEKKAAHAEGSEGGEGFDEEAQARMLAEIAAKEERAQEMLREAQVSAQIMKEEAQKECEALKEAAKVEIDNLKEAAKEEGHQEGYEQGKEDGLKAAEEETRDTIREANKRAENLMETARQDAMKALKETEVNIAETVLHVVEKILPRHFLDVPQVILPAVQEALKKVYDQKEINIHVAPNAYDVVLMAKDELRAGLTAGVRLDITSDESLKEGDCVIDTPNGSVDARLATQIELIRQAVQEILPT